MKKQLNEKLIMISGKVPIAKKLELGEDYRIVLEVGVIQEQKRDNQDGSYDIVYVCRPITVDKLQ